MDQAMEIGCLGMYDIIRREWSNWNLMVDGHLPNRLKQNGTDCKEKLPNYPYRDDALLIWNAIHNYVSEIVNSVYSESISFIFHYKIASVGILSHFYLSMYFTRQRRCTAQ